MAAPHVSGTLALVQQAFPWMSASQLADTVLSTAQKPRDGQFDVISIHPGSSQTDPTHENADYHWQFGGRQYFSVASPSYSIETGEYETNVYQESAAIVFWGSAGEATADIDALKEQAAERATGDWLERTLEDADWDMDPEAYRQAVYKAYEEWKTYFKEHCVIVEYAIGAGLLDAASAVGGIAELNVNRMARWDSANNTWQLPVETGLNGKEQIAYTLNLAGNGVSYFTNDIDEVRWNPTLHITTEEELKAYNEAIANGRPYEGSSAQTQEPDNADLPVSLASTLSESILGSMAMINQATEFVADEGLLMAESSARSDATTLFGAMYGGKSSYDTAGDLDLDSMHLIVGASTRVSDTVLAAFFEAGWGDSDNRYATSSGNADHEYYGVGLALRHFVSDTFFLDASLHGGMSSTDYSGRFASSGATFDDNSLFAAAHLGAGMRFALTDTLMTEVYGRYALNWLSSESIRIDAADRSTLEYDDVFVHTLRFGTRLRHQLTDQFAWSAGLAYERTLQSDLKADVNNLAIDGVSLEGNTGVGELSATYRKSADSPWAASVVLKGYVGQRQGAAGQVRLDYRF